MFFHAKNGKETIIASWKLALVRILGVFNVCSVAFCTAIADHSPQAKIPINMNANTSAIHCDIANMHITVSNIHDDVAS